MASKNFAILDIQNDEDELENLSFQDFGDTKTVSSTDKYEQTINFTDFPDSAQDEQEQKLLDNEDDQSKKPTYSLWSFEFYQQLFDVDSKHVGDRIIWSMVPKPGTSYLQTYIRPNPDLYGPFWICLTLVFTTAISGNVSNYLSASTKAYKWKYDFHKVTFAASAIYAYAWLVPVAMWGVLLWRKSKSNISLLELLCLYGYSLAIFVPVSILWVIPQPWFRFCLAIVAPILSGSVLVRTVWPALSHDSKKIAIIIAVVIMVLHATLALGFMLYFFNTPKVENVSENKSALITSQPDTIEKVISTISPKIVEKSASVAQSALASNIKDDDAPKEQSDASKDTVNKDVDKDNVIKEPENKSSKSESSPDSDKVDVQSNVSKLSKM